MQLVIPIPSDFLGIVWFALGITVGRAFKTFDHDLQETDWFRSLPKISQIFVRIFMDCFHHWWIGAFLMLYAPHDTELQFGLLKIVLQKELYWLGAGLLIDDMPDIPLRVKNAFSYILRRWNT